MSTRPKIQCRACRHQVSLTAGTIFHATKLPLTTWFLAMWLIATAKNGISSVELGRRLGIKQTNAWAMKQKIMEVMAGREATKPLGGRVEMDDAYLGGHRPGKRGPGRRRQAALRGGGVDHATSAARARSSCCRSRASVRSEVKKLVAEHLASTRRLVTDGLSCWTAVGEAGLEHTAIVTGSGKRAAQWSPFKWVNTTLGNVKAAITGTYRQSAPSMPAAISPASPGASTAASSSPA